MTRQWHTPTSIMCRKHLLGEHVEHHMLLGTFRKKKSVSGFIKNNCLEPISLKERHDEIVAEMIKRGYNHKSDLDFSLSDIDYLSWDEQTTIIDRESSLKDLISRCKDCNNNANSLKV